MTNELDTSWHTSSHSRHQPPASSPMPGRRGSASGGRRGSGVSKAAAVEAMHGSMSSVDEDCGVTESTRTLSVETHGNYDNHSQASGGKHHQDDSDDDDDDDDDLNDVDSFGETSPTDRTDKEKLEKCLASGVSSRLMDFRINYDSKAAFDLDDVDEEMEQANKDGKKSSKPRSRIVGSVANALRRVVHRGGNNEKTIEAGLSTSSHQKK